MDTNLKTIPDEILFIILTMLPAESLLRFRCVSKHWLSIISDPYFVAAHYSRSKSRPKLLISVRRDSSMYGHSPDNKLIFYSIDYPEEDQPLNLHATAHGSINCSNCYVISRSEGGIICFNSHQGIRIGNPITGEFKLIIEHPAVAGDFPNGKFVRHYSGIDPIDETKVVLRLDDSLSRQDGRNNRLFSLHESRWQWHDTAPLPQPFDKASYSSICMNGVIYFTANVRDDFDRQLYAFDVRLESFEMIWCPPNVATSFGSRITELVIEYKDHVALVGYSRHAGAKKVTNEIHMWILEDPKEHSWSFKSFEVPWTDFFTRISSTLSGATHRGELIFATGRVLREGYINLYLFEIDTNTLRRFQVDGFGPTDSYYSRVQLSFLIESLESPKEAISLN